MFFFLTSCVFGFELVLVFTLALTIHSFSSEQSHCSDSDHQTKFQTRSPRGRKLLNTILWRWNCGWWFLLQQLVRSDGTTVSCPNSPIALADTAAVGRPGPSTDVDSYEDTITAVSTQLFSCLKLFFVHALWLVKLLNAKMEYGRGKMQLKIAGRTQMQLRWRKRKVTAEPMKKTGEKTYFKISVGPGNRENGVSGLTLFQRRRK